MTHRDSPRARFVFRSPDAAGAWMPTDPTSKILAAILAAFVSCLIVASSFAQGPAVHLRTYAWEPYVARAVEFEPKNLAFNSVWVHGKYYPDEGDIDTANPDARQQGILAREKADLVTSKLGIPATAGYVVHPTDWFNRAHWQRRADAIEAFLDGGNFSDTLALDIEGYGKRVDGQLIRVAPPYGESTFWRLYKAATPVRAMLQRRGIKATFYPAGGNKFEHYTMAAVALGASTMADEYSFIFADKLDDPDYWNSESWRVWKARLADQDPNGIGIPVIPGFFASNFKNGPLDRFLLGWMGIKECWLFVHDKGYLSP